MEILRMAFVYVGTVMGAAFAGGREVATFFIERPPVAVVALVTAGVLFCVSGSVVCYLARKHSVTSFAAFTKTVFRGRWADIVNLLSVAFLFVTYSSMLSAAGAMLNVICGVSHTVGAVVSNIILYLIFSGNREGVVRANVILSPLILLAVASVFAVSCILPNVIATSSADTAKSVADGSIYVGYNFLTAMGALVVASSSVSGTKKAIAGTVIGGIMLCGCLFMEYFVLIKYPTICETSPLPMLSIASSYGRAWTVFYSMALYAAIITTCAGCGESICGANEKSRNRSSLLLCICALPVSMMSFSVIVRRVFSAFGYMGAVVLAKTIFNAVKERKQEKNRAI